MKHKPVAFPCHVKLERPSALDKTADRDRLEGQLQRMGMAHVEIPLNVQRKLSEALRAGDFELDVVIGVKPSKSRNETGWRLIDIGKATTYGLAIDIGTTNIECAMFDLSTAEKILIHGVENPQIKFGHDVLTRVQRSMTGESSLMSDVLADGINRMIRGICELKNISADEIAAVTVAGNTIETHFFLGLDVRNIPLSPYVPAVNGAFFSTAAEIGLEMNQNASVYVFPNAGSYVGGDVISGILFSGLSKEERPCLFIDVGTNVEVTLGCRDWIMVGAGAAGPALEGGVAGIGKKAESGAIYKVKINSENKKAEVEIIGGGEPTGICGSGLIDLVSEMFSSGVIDSSGTLCGPEEDIPERMGEKAYIVYGSAEKELYLTQSEIKNFILSKAAMFSFLYVFVKSVGLTFRDIDKVYVAGALGCGIDLQSAMNIGMMPDIPKDKFIPLGNSSLQGAAMVLLDSGLVSEVDQIAKKITYREMNEDGELMSVLQGAMFIPHTEPDLLKG